MGKRIMHTNLTNGEGNVSLLVENFETEILHNNSTKARSMETDYLLGVPDLNREDFAPL